MPKWSSSPADTRTQPLALGGFSAPAAQNGGHAQGQYAMREGVGHAGRRADEAIAVNFEREGAAGVENLAEEQCPSATSTGGAAAVSRCALSRRRHS